MQKQKIVIGKPEHAATITEFQLKMAMETEHLKLDQQLVSQAVQYFLSLTHEESISKEGIYLVKLVDEEVVGSLLLTFQTSKRWWIQSVFVKEEARRKGHFTSLFEEAVRLARAHKAISIKLYAESSNSRAKTTYYKLGMKETTQKFYSYDFVYGGHKKPQYLGPLNVKRIETQQQKAKVNELSHKNIFNGQITPQTDWNDGFMIQKGQQLLGAASCFSQFSDWRFGVMRYVRQLHLKNGEDVTEAKEICNALITHLISTQKLQVGAVRFIVTSQYHPVLEGGNFQHYDILEIKLD